MNRQGIEGIPAWAKVAGMRQANKSDWFADGSSQIFQWKADFPSGRRHAILLPDNVYDRVDLENYPIPEGHRRVEAEWFRTPKKSELFVSPIDGSVSSAILLTDDTRRIIVCPIKPTVKVLVVEWDNWQYGPDIAFDGVKPNRSRVEEREV